MSAKKVIIVVLISFAVIVGWWIWQLSTTAPDVFIV